MKKERIMALTKEELDLILDVLKKEINVINNDGRKFKDAISSNMHYEINQNRIKNITNVISKLSDGE